MSLPGQKQQTRNYALSVINPALQVAIRNKTTKKQLAKRLGISYQAVLQWYHVQSFPSFKNLVKIAEMFDTDFGKLYDDCEWFKEYHRQAMKQTIPETEAVEV